MAYQVLVLGVRFALRFLAKKLDAAQDLRPIYDTEVDALVRDFFDKQFTTEGEHGGTPWKPLTQTTVMFKDRFGPAKAGASAILQNEGLLRRSLTIRGAQHGVFKTTRSTYKRGTTRRGAAEMQDGFMSTHIFGKRRRMAVKVAARKIVPKSMPSPFTSELASIVANYLQNA